MDLTSSLDYLSVGNQVDIVDCDTGPIVFASDVVAWVLFLLECKSLLYCFANRCHLMQGFVQSM